MRKLELNPADLIGNVSKLVAVFLLKKVGVPEKNAEDIGEVVENLVHGLGLSENKNSMLKTIDKMVDQVWRTYDKDLSAVGLDVTTFKEILSPENLFVMLSKPDTKVELLGFIMSELPSDSCGSDVDERINRIVNQLYDDFEKEILSNHELASIVILKLNQEQEKSIRQLTEKDNELRKIDMERIRAYLELVERFTEYAKNSRKKDTYDGLGFINETIFLFVVERLKPGCDEHILNLAYFLTDIYDRVSEYEKAIVIADEIIKIINKDVEKKETNLLDKSKLRMLVGCYYSIIVKKSERTPEREAELNKIREEYENIDGFIDIWYTKPEVKSTDYMFLRALFESDYGALYLKIYQDVTGNQDDLAIAEKHHLNAKAIRQKLFDTLSMWGDENLKDAENRLFQSKSNLAEVYYFQQKYEEAISLHNEVLNYRIKQCELRNKEINTNTGVIYSKKYLAGCYVALWIEGKLEEENKNKCRKYMEECIEYYRKGNDDERLSEMEELKKKIPELMSILNE